ncbi:hypothetical protein BX666DRAFT_1875602 [Dichotomocladium elegans]|nr:hypothetical protein BX666DRAFT_1875602 [Dichotomocladium elegans]
MFSLDRLKENTFLLATGATAIVAWIIAFGGLCGYRMLSDVSYWIIVYELFLVLGILYVFATSTFLHYRMAVCVQEICLLTFLAISVALLHGEINSVLPATNHRAGAAGAFAAGYIILIIVQFLWVFVFGSEPNSYIGQFGHGWTAMSNTVDAHVPKQQENYNTAASVPVPVPMPMPMPMPSATSQAGSAPPQQYEMGDKTMVSPGGFGGSNAPAHPAAAASSPVSAASPNTPSAYTIQVEALHDYTASPDDPSELSFVKGESLHVVERKGNWWQARKADGTTGIIPSNYFAP